MQYLVGVDFEPKAHRYKYQCFSTGSADKYKNAPCAISRVDLDIASFA